MCIRWTMNKNSVFIQPLSFNLVHSFRLFLVVHSISIWLACNDCTLAAILHCSDQWILELCVGTHKWIYGKFNYLNYHIFMYKNGMNDADAPLPSSSVFCTHINVQTEFRSMFLGYWIDRQMKLQFRKHYNFVYCVCNVSVWPIVRLYLHYCTLHYLCTMYCVLCFVCQNHTLMWLSIWWSYCTQTLPIHAANLEHKNKTSLSSLVTFFSCLAFLHSIRIKCIGQRKYTRKKRTKQTDEIKKKYVKTKRNPTKAIRFKWNGYEAILSLLLNCTVCAPPWQILYIFNIIASLFMCFSRLRSGFHSHLLFGCSRSQ